jgi:hypothetical protein
MPAQQLCCEETVILVGDSTGENAIRKSALSSQFIIKSKTASKQVRGANADLRSVCSGWAERRVEVFSREYPAKWVYKPGD